MKNTLIAIALMIGMTSCTKEETPTPQPQPQPTTQIDTLDWTLDVESTQLNIIYKNIHPLRVNVLLGDNDTPIGKVFRYEINGDAFNLFYVWDGDMITTLTGRIGTHTFINAAPPISSTTTLINMCNDPQGASVTFTLYDYKQQVKGLRSFGF